MLKALILMFPDASGSTLLMCMKYCWWIWWVRSLHDVNSKYFWSLFFLTDSVKPYNSQLPLRMEQLPVCVQQLAYSTHAWTTWTCYSRYQPPETLHKIKPVEKKDEWIQCKWCLLICIHKFCSSDYSWIKISPLYQSEFADIFEFLFFTFCSLTWTSLS